MNSSWRVISFGHVLSKSNGQIEVQPTESYQQVTVRMWGNGVVPRGEITGSEVGSQRWFIARAGQFIMSRIDARHGAFGLIPDGLDGAIVSNDFPLFDINLAELMPEYLYWLSRTYDFIDLCKRASEGTTNRVRLKIERFLESEIPLPPLDEQRRIVAHIEALAARIAEARGLRHGALEEAEGFWLSALKQLRENLLNQNYPINFLGNITTVTAGGTPSRDVIVYWDGDIPWIKTGELLDGDIYSADEFITEEGLKNSSAKLFPPETVLIALYGQGQTRGRTGRLMIEATTNQACCAILPAEELDSRYLQYWLRSLYLEMREISHGGAQPNWNSKMIKRIRIAGPEISIQHDIVAYLDDLYTQVDELKRLQAETAAELDALLPSLLDRAFKGEL